MVADCSPSLAVCAAIAARIPAVRLLDRAARRRCIRHSSRTSQPRFSGSAGRQLKFHRPYPRFRTIQELPQGPAGQPVVG